MRGNCYQWAFDFMLDFMWHNSEADPDQYNLCVGIVRDSQYGKCYDHAWIEDTTTAEIFNRYNSARKIKHTPKEEYYRLMNPRYVKRYTGREMIKKVLRNGMPSLLSGVPSKVLKAPDFKGHWDDRLRSRKQTGEGPSKHLKVKLRKR